MSIPTSFIQKDLHGVKVTGPPTYIRRSHRVKYPGTATGPDVTPGPVTPSASTPPKLSELPLDYQLDMVLAATFAVAERGQKRAELLLDLMEPASPCDIEKATKRDPIVLSPAGKFQRILNAAE